MNLGISAGTNQNTPKKKVSQDQFRERLVTLCQAAANYDSDTAAKIIEEIKTYQLPESWDAYIDKCSSLMDDFDYDSLEGLVRNMVGFLSR
jgi:hypothetical protein